MTIQWLEGVRHNLEIHKGPALAELLTIESQFLPSNAQQLPSRDRVASSLSKYENWIEPVLRFIDIAHCSCEARKLKNALVTPSYHKTSSLESSPQSKSQKRSGKKKQTTTNESTKSSSVDSTNTILSSHTEILYSSEDISQIFGLQVKYLNSVLSNIINWPAWSLPVLFAACRDTYRLASKSSNPDFLETTARLLNRAFGVCTTDTAEIAQSRKWGTYYVVVLLFRVYSKLDTLSLTKNIVQVLSVSKLPPIEYFPKSHIVSFRYFLGMTAFMASNYEGAATELSQALSLCLRQASHNIELILRYLILSNVIAFGKLPSKTLLGKFPLTSQLFREILNVHFAQGNVAAFDSATQRRESQFVQLRATQAISRIRHLCIRNLLKKTWLCLGKAHRIPMTHLHQALKLGMGNEQLTMEETYITIANSIHMELVRGYISYSHQMVVLSKSSAFPSLS